MEQHPIPRQITTFEFKLIGFMTVKQLIYLIVFIPLAVIVFYLFPIPILNFIFAILVGLFGVALAFLPIYDRPLDNWLINLYKRLTSPTQYFYQKNNPPIYFLTDVIVANSSSTEAFIQSQKYLNQYLQKTVSSSSSFQVAQKKQQINQLFQIPIINKKEKKIKLTTNQLNQNLSQKPFFSGIVKNYKLLPIPGILIYVKNDQGEIIRLLKTNPHGVFATFKSLPAGEYVFEIKDPKNIYNFDTIKIKIEKENPKPIQIYSKELL